MSLRLLFTTTLFLYCTSNAIFASETASVEISKDFIVKFSKDKGASYNSYLSAYLQGIIDAEFPQSGTAVSVGHGQVSLQNLPADQAEQDRIIRSVRKVVSQEKKTTTKSDSQVTGSWFPESAVLYPTQLANPLRVCFSGGLRLHDSVAGQVSTPVTFGDELPLYRWDNFEFTKMKGKLQLDVEGAIFAIFNQTRPSSPLINADYYVGVPLSFASGRWAHRARIYHISSHLGDEYMKRRHHAKRLNKSFEALDLCTSYFITDQIRVYGGVGVIGHSDSEMHLKPLYAMYGLEVHAGRVEWKDTYGTPYIAMHFQNYQDCGYQMDSNFAIGYEWGKLNGLGKKLRVALEYHNGHCGEGQFSRKHSDYIQAVVSWGF
jgi:hypothetical protein